MISSLSIQNFDCLMLQSGTNATSIRLRLGLLASIELIPEEVFLFNAFKHIDLTGVVIVNEAPAAGVDELAGVRLCFLAVAGRHTSELDLTRWQKINSWDGLIADGNLALRCADVNSTEAGEVLEECTVWGSHGQLHLWKFRKDAKVSDGVLRHQVVSCDDGTS